MENFEGNLQIDKPVQKPEQISDADKETSQTIAMDFILQRVPPIEGRFNPSEEVRKLWLVPKEKRREAVSAFKDKLYRQREAWALCRTTIEEKIEANPDISKQELVGIIGQFASSYGFAESHISTAEQLIDGYITQHKRVREIREKYPDDIALVKRLTGINFTKADAEDFSIKVGPMSVEISCSGFNAGRIYRKSLEPIPGFMYGGFAAESRDKEPVFYLVVNNDYATTNPDYYASTVPHEREHQKNRILGPKLYGQSGMRVDVREKLNRGIIGERLLGFERESEDEIYKRYESAKDPEEKAFLLREYMRLIRESALNRAKDEIIALKAEPGYYLSNYSLYTYNIFLSQDGGPYDYLAYLRNRNEKKGDSLWQEISKRVFVDEYRDIIDRAIIAFDRLKGGRYSRKEVIAMLSDKRLQEWPKTVRRLLGAGDKEFDPSYRPSAIEIYDTYICQSELGKRMVFDRRTGRICKIVNSIERPASESEIKNFSRRLLRVGLSDAEIKKMKNNLPAKQKSE